MSDADFLGPELIVYPGTGNKDGFSDPMVVQGKRGRFNWNADPEYNPHVGHGKSPMYRFETEDGGAWNLRLEKDRQGGRWEEADHAEEEYEQIKLEPERAIDMWGLGNPVADILIESAVNREPWEKVKEKLSRFESETWRQISAD